jgi:hypothetical protein
MCGWEGGRVGSRRRRTASEIHARELKKKTDVDEEEAKFMLEYRAKRVQEMQEEVRGVCARRISVHVRALPRGSMHVRASVNVYLYTRRALARAQTRPTGAFVP